MHKKTKPPAETSFIKGRFHSFGYAFIGIATLMREQQNAWVHLLATCLVVLLGFWLGISASDWALLIIAMVLVWMAEALNTAVELLCDLVCEDYHPLIKKAKDIAAGAVLVTAIGATMIGVIVLLPYLD